MVAPVPFVRSVFLEPGVLPWMLFLALLFHGVAFLAYVVYHPELSSDDTTFFTSVTRVEHATIDRVIIAASSPPPQAAPATPQAASTPSRAPGPAPQARPAPAPRPVSNNVPVPRVINRVVAPPDPSASMVAVKPDPRGRPEGVPGGDPNGVPGGSGNGGNGPGGDGSGGNGPGGTGPGGTGPGGTGDGGGGSRERTTSVTWYPRFEKLGLSDRGMSAELQMAASRVNNWQELCTLVGIDYAGDLAKRPLVEPFFTSTYNPSVQEQMALGGREGKVLLQVTVYANGQVSPQIAESTGDAELDRVGFAVGQYTRWLPALRNGQPVDHTFTYWVQFRSEKMGRYDDGPAPPPGMPPP